jgi:hypothetical protein
MPTRGGQFVPDNGDIVDLARAWGISGTCIPSTTPSRSRIPGTTHLRAPVDVALGKVDYLEVMGFSNHLITAESGTPAQQRIPHSAGRAPMPWPTTRAPRLPGLVWVSVMIGRAARSSHLA